MDIVSTLLFLLRAVAGLILIFFIPGYAFTWLIYTRRDDLTFIVRIALSSVLSIAIVMLSALVLDFILGIETTGLNVTILLLALTFYFTILYAARVILDIHGHIVPKAISVWYQKIQLIFSRRINSNRDRFAKTAMTSVVWHHSLASGRNHVDHYYLIDIEKEIDIHQIDENKWKNSNACLVPRPYPKTRYFELVIAEYKEEGVSLVDDLQLYPVHVARIPDIIILGFRIKRGALKITERMYKKTSATEIQWIYSHDFHLFAVLHSEDNLRRMVDRVLLKLDEIATSIQRGSRIPSHVEETQKLREESDVVLEKPRGTPRITEVPASYPKSPVSAHPVESDRRKLQANIVRDLRTDRITPETFRSSDRMITTVKIPDKSKTSIIKEALKELEDDDWLYE